jgi:hypothetical protein
LRFGPVEWRERAGKGEHHQQPCSDRPFLFHAVRMFYAKTETFLPIFTDDLVARHAFAAGRDWLLRRIIIRKMKRSAKSGKDPSGSP